MPATAFNHFNLRAGQPLLDKLRDFYVEVVGMKVGWRPPFNFHGYWLYLGDTAVLHLVELPARSGAAEEPTGTFDHVAFSCTDLAEFEQRLQDHRIPYRRAAVPGTSQQQLFVKDPAGNGVEFNFERGDA